MHLDLARLFAEICQPSRFQFALLVFARLSILLLLDIVVGEDLHGLIIVAFDLKVAVRDDYALSVLRVCNRSWQQEVSQLNLEQH